LFEFKRSRKKQKPGNSLPEKNGFFQEESFNTNVASCGEFDLIEANDNLKYYTAVGDILNHKDMVSLLKETMVYFTNKLIELREEFDK
jgi:hypothetical protein